MINKQKPKFSGREVELIKEVLDSGWITRGKKVEKLEEMFREYTGAKYALATSSATTALHLQLLALGIGKGDEVIVPAFTWVATPNVVEMVGANPIFCDISLDYNINVEKIEKLITERTKAIMPVHLFGVSADMDKIMAIADKHGLKVIEDAACSLGTFYKGKHTGTIGDCGSFSLHPAKTITTGEGGVVVTDNKELYDLMFKLHDHGTPDYDVVAYNYRMTDIQGAIGICQMEILQEILDKRKEKAEIYNKALSDEITPYIPKYSNHTYQSYVVYVGERDRVSAELEKRGIIAKRGTLNVADLPYYKNKYGFSDCVISQQADKNTLTLPLYVDMGEEQKEVIKGLNEILKSY